jgi:hypothetical protein
LNASTAEDPVATAKDLLVEAIVASVPSSYTPHQSKLRTRTIILTPDIRNSIDLDVALARAHRMVRVGAPPDLVELRNAVKMVQRFQTALFEDDLAELDAVAKYTPIELCNEASTRALRETILLARHVVRYSDVVKELFLALSEGGMSGSVGSVDLSTIRTEALSAGVNAALQIRQSDHKETDFWFQNTGATTDSFLGNLLEVARLVLAIRTAAAEGRWIMKHNLVGKSVEVLLREVENEHVKKIEVVKDELKFAMDEVENRKAIDEIIGKLRVGASFVRVRGDLSEIKTDELNDAFVAAQKIGYKSPKLALYMQLATFILELRRALQRREWATLSDILSAAPDASETAREVEASQDLLDQLTRTNERLEHALRTSVGDIQVANSSKILDIEALESAIRYASQQPCKSETTEKLVRSCVLLRDLRISQKGAKDATKLDELVGILSVKVFFLARISTLHCRAILLRIIEQLNEIQDCQGRRERRKQPCSQRTHVSF